MTPRARPVVALAAFYPPDEFEGFEFHNYGVHAVEAALRAAVPEAEVVVVEEKDSRVDELSRRLSEIDPDVLGLSAYLWSFPSLVEVARRRRRSSPDTTIVMGGPAAHPRMFDLPPFRDAPQALDAIVARDAGTDGFAAAARLGRGARAALAGVPGLSVPAAWGAPSAARPPAPLARFVSPYQAGLMPRGGTAYLRTFEGCPLSCSYCEWGAQGDPQNVFSADYLARELAAFEERGATGVLLIDAALNLNPHAFEQLSVAESRARVLRDREFICELYPSLMTPAHLAFLEGIRSPLVQVGLQSLDPDVLRGLDRPFDQEMFFRVLGEVSRVAPVTVEIILGLPGDNPASFRMTFSRLRELGCRVRVYYCVVLPSALMTRAPAEFALRFDPVTLKVRSCLGWSERDLAREASALERLARDEGGGGRAAFWWDFSPLRPAAAAR